MPDLHFVQLTASTRQNRFEAVHLIQQAIEQSGGWILDFRQFSNQAAVIFFEIEGALAPDLNQALLKTGVRWNEKSLEDLKRLNQPFPPNSEIKGSIHLTLIHTEPDLRIGIPPIPG